MADRSHYQNGSSAPVRPRGGVSTANGSSSGAAAAAAEAGPPIPAIRRNLFQNGGGVSGMHNGRVTRRPVPSLSAKSSERLRMEADAQAGPPAAVVVSSPEQPREIVVRDRHGEIEMGSPASPEMDDQGDSPLDSQKEADEESHRLVEAIKSHQMHSAGLQDHPDELLEAVKTSMRGKVARLSEDSWMYERGPGRGI